MAPGRQPPRPPCRLTIAAIPETCPHGEGAPLVVAPSGWGCRSPSSLPGAGPGASPHARLARQSEKWAASAPGGRRLEQVWKL